MIRYRVDLRPETNVSDDPFRHFRRDWEREATERLKSKTIQELAEMNPLLAKLLRENEKTVHPNPASA